MDFREYLENRLMMKEMQLMRAEDNGAHEEVIIRLNIEYPKFLKAIPKMNNKEILKHPLMKSLEELKCLMSGQKSL